MSIPPDRRASLISLLDDSNPVVRDALIDEFRRWKEPGLLLLQELARGDEVRLAEPAQELLQELASADPIRSFQEFIRSYNYELETGSLMLSKTLYPDLNIAQCCLFLDEIADRCKELMVKPSSAIEKCRVLNRVIFHEYGFVGDVENFYNPENSFLHRVIERRRGIPISLSIIYLLVAYRCDIGLEAIGLPGRFMVGCYLQEEPFFIDVYERGVFRTVEDIEAMLERNDIELDPSYLTPTPVGDVLMRCCRNLVNQYTEMHDSDKAQLFAGFLDEFEDAYKRET